MEAFSGKWQLANHQPGDKAAKIISSIGRRIDSRFLLLGAARLPHLNCYPSSARLVRGGGGDGEATKHGDTQGTKRGNWAALPGGKRWERRQILDEFARVTGYHRKHALRVLHRPFVAQAAATAQAHI